MKKAPSIYLCLIMDLIGYATYAFPGYGEFADIIWAPISALVFYAAWGGKKGAIGGIINFTEEILPFSDFIPTFTIMWVWQWYTNKQNKIPIKT